MTIERGAAWGLPGRLPAGAPVVWDDATLARTARSGAPVVGLCGGDLYRTCGGRPGAGQARMAADDAQHLPVDLGWVRLDGAPERPFAAHLVARRSWWHGTLVAVMNAQFLGTWDVAPRGHPNDGRLDVVVVDPAMGVRDRWRARGRLATGTHLPHPAIETRSARSWRIDLPEPLTVWLDGLPVGAASVIEVRCQPDALTVVV
jgi:hypothetical protein